jgi:hypothetical protein
MPRLLDCGAGYSKRFLHRRPTRLSSPFERQRDPASASTAWGPSLPDSAGVIDRPSKRTFGQSSICCDIAATFERIEARGE